jgi:hypothetical protein
LVAQEQGPENDFIVAKNPQLDYAKRQLGDNVRIEYRLGLPTANAVIIAVDPALAIVILARVSLIVFKELFTVLRKLLL